MNEEIKSVCQQLNRLLAADPDAITALLEFQVPCSQCLIEDPVMQCIEKHGEHRISGLGLLNVVVEHLTGMRVAAVCPDENSQQFEAYLSFRPYDPTKHTCSKE